MVGRQFLRDGAAQGLGQILWTRPATKRPPASDEVTCMLGATGQDRWKIVELR